MNQQTTQFERRPGTGYLFGGAKRPDAQSIEEINSLTLSHITPDFPYKGHFVVLWEGPLTLESGKTIQIRARGHSRLKQYVITAHEYGQDGQDNAWKQIGEATMPTLGDQTYQETTIKIYDRPYKLRISKTERDHMIMRLPQVTAGQRAQSSMI